MELDKFLKDVAIGLVEDTAASALDKLNEVSKPIVEARKRAVDKITDAATYVSKIQQEASQKSFIKKAKSKTKDHYHRVMRHNTEYLDQYEIYDDDTELKYTAAGNFQMGKKQVLLYNIRDEEIAIVRNKRFAIRSPLTADFYTKPQDYTLIQGKEEIGEVRSKFSMSKNLYTTTIEDWKIEGSLAGLSYYVYSNNEIIMSLVKKFHTKWGETYVIDYPDESLELYYLMIALVISISDDLLTKVRKNAKTIINKL